MSLWTSLEPASTTVDPGSTTTVRLRLRNTGDVVDEYRFTPVGDIAPYITVEPPTIRLYPGTTGTVQLTFAPPRTPDATAGPNPYAVQIVPTEHPEATTVPEGNLTITPFTEIRAELVPHTVKGRFRGRPKLAIDNLGNTKLTASVLGNDNGDQLSYEIHPANVQIEPGRAAFVKATLKPRQITWFGRKENRPYQLAVQRSGSTRLDVDGTYIQRGVLPRWLATFLSLAVGLTIACVALWFAYQPNVTSLAQEKLQQAAASTIPTPTTAAPLIPAPSPTPTTAAPATTAAQTQAAGGGGGGGASATPKPKKTQHTISGPTGTITGPATTGKCVDVDTNTPTSGNAVQLWTCNGVSGQQWTVESDGTLRAFGKCLDIVGNGTANFTKVQLWQCDGVGGQQWIPRANGSLRNPQSGRCLDDPQGNTADGTKLQIYDCNGLSPQVWNIA